MGFLSSLVAPAQPAKRLCRLCAVSQEWEQMHLERRGAGWPADGPPRINK